MSRPEHALTDLSVSTSSAEELNLMKNGFSILDQVLNKDSKCSPTYIWYKNSPNIKEAITRIQVSYNEDTAKGLSKAGYVKVPRNADRPLIPETSIYLWYFKGDTQYDTPITELEVSTHADDEARKMKRGFQRVGCNLSGVADKWVYLWVEREEKTYICDVNATISSGSDKDLYQDGFIRIDQSTTTTCEADPCGCHPECGINSDNFLWYRLTSDPKRALTDLQVSTTRSELNACQEQGFQSVDVNLVDGKDGSAVFLWYKKVEGKSPVQSMLLLLRHGFDPFISGGAIVIEKNINVNGGGDPRYLSYMKHE